MPVVIRELIVRGQVAGGDQPEDQKQVDPQQIEELKKEIVKECLDKILVVIEKKNER